MRRPSGIVNPPRATVIVRIADAVAIPADAEASTSRHHVAPACRMQHPRRPCAVNLHRLDLFSLSLFSLVARSGSISKGAELAPSGGRRRQQAHHRPRGGRGRRAARAPFPRGHPDRRRPGAAAACAAHPERRRSAGRRPLRLRVGHRRRCAPVGQHVGGHAVPAARHRRLRDCEPRHPDRTRGSRTAAKSCWRCWTAEPTSASLPTARLRLGLHVMDYRRDRLVLVVPRGHALARRRAVRFRGSDRVRLRQPLQGHFARQAAAVRGAKRSGAA